MSERLYTRREMIKNELLKCAAAASAAGMAADSAHIPAPKRTDLLKPKELKTATKNGAIIGSINAVISVCFAVGLHNIGEITPFPAPTSRRTFLSDTNRIILKAAAIPLFAGAVTPPLMSLTGQVDEHFIHPEPGDHTRSELIHDIVYPPENIDLQIT